MTKIKKLNVPPSSFGDKNKWADYIELLCISSLDNLISSDEIFDKIFGDKSDDENEDISLTDEIEEDGDDFDLGEETQGSKEDSRKAKINGIFEFLLSRKSLFKQYYPFEVSDSPYHIKLISKLSYKQYSYLNLLLSSNLDYLKKYKPELTTKFEENSVFVFKKLFPENSKIEYFGKGNERSKHFSENKLSKRIKQLSQILKIPLSPNFDEEEINEHNTGDGGLDLVGWSEFMDSNSGMIINFGQCACGKEWFDKQFDIHPAKWNNYLHIDQPLIRTLLTPSSFRRYDGDWFKKMKIYDCIIIDRYRFLTSLRKRENSKVATSNLHIVEEVMSWNSDYFN